MKTTKIKPFAKTEEIEANYFFKKKYKKEITEPDKIESSSFLVNFSDMYTPITHIASGGIGVISKAKDNVFGRIVAVKALQEELADDPIVVSRFIKECQLNAKLDHPSIVPIYGLGKDNEGHWHIAMKYVSGVTLRNFINDLLETYLNKKINLRSEHVALLSRLEYFVKLCEVVSYCHRHNIVHGDIKPENIIIGHYGDLYLMDWGCASTIGKEWDEPTGTPKYLPPEFFKKPQSTCLVDIYSLGIILFELVTMKRGGNPIEEKDCVTTLNDWVNVEEDSSYQHLAPNLSIDYRLKAIIKKAICPDPSERYLNVQDLLVDIRRFMYDDEVSVVSDNLYRRFMGFLRHHSYTVLLFAITSALLGSMGLFYHFYSTSTMMQQQRISHINQLNLLQKTNILSQEVEQAYLLTHQRIFRLTNLLAETYKGVSRKYYQNADFTNLETVPQDFAFNERFGRKVSVEEPVVLAVGEYYNKLISPHRFAQICQGFMETNFNNSSLAKRINESTDYINRIYIEWYDGTRYSFPGSYEDPKNRYFKRRWKALSGGNDDIRWSKPYCEDGVWYVERQYPIFTNKNQRLGMLGVQVRLLSFQSSLVNSSVFYPKQEFFIIEIRDVVIACNRGDIKVVEDKSYFGIDVKKIISLRHQMEEKNQQIIEFEYKGKGYFFCGVRLIQLYGSCFCQIVPKEEYHKNTILNSFAEKHKD